MNIFHLHNDPVVSAQMMCDKHVVKMILESAQILSTVLNKCGEKTTYKPTHHNHPSVLWAGTSQENFAWLREHGLALCQEYTNRYKKQHASEKYFLTELFVSDKLPDCGLTTFAQAMPEQYKDVNPVRGYRKYYLGEKSYFAKWTNRDVPGWFLYNDVDLEF